MTTWLQPYYNLTTLLQLWKLITTAISKEFKIKQDWLRHSQHMKHLATGIAMYRILAHTTLRIQNSKKFLGHTQLNLFYVQ